VAPSRDHVVTVRRFCTVSAERMVALPTDPTQPCFNIVRDAIETSCCVAFYSVLMTD